MMENAEAPAPAFFSANAANAVPEHVVDMALSAGGVWPDSDLRIYARYPWMGSRILSGQMKAA